MQPGEVEALKRRVRRKRGMQGQGAASWLWLWFTVMLVQFLAVYGSDGNPEGKHHVFFLRKEKCTLRCHSVID